jgi:hypothetical protein
LKQAGEIIFKEFGRIPGNSYTGIELKDDLPVSLLWARLIELNLPSSDELNPQANKAIPNSRI